MRIEKKFDEAIQSTKEMILCRVRQAYLISDIYDYEEELLTKSLSKVIKENQGSEEQFLELLAINYMVQGICANHVCDIYERGASSE